MQGKKRTLRLIYFKPLRFPSVPLFKLSNVLPLNLLYFKTICLIMHNVFDNVKPLNVCNSFTHSAKIHSHNVIDHLRNSFSSIDAIYGIVFPTVLMLYQNINLRTSYRISHWIFTQQNSYVAMHTLDEIFSKY